MGGAHRRREPQPCLSADRLSAEHRVLEGAWATLMLCATTEVGNSPQTLWRWITFSAYESELVDGARRLADGRRQGGGFRVDDRRRFGAAGRRPGKAGRRARRLARSGGRRRRLRRRGADDLAGVPPAGAGQPVLPDRVPRRDAAAGVPGLPVRGRAGSIRTTGPVARLAAGRDHPGGLPLPGAAVPIGRRRRLQRLPGPAGPARPDRRRDGRAAARARPRGVPADHGLGAARRLPAVPRATATTAGCCPRAGRSRTPGCDFDQIVDALYNSGSGFYGTPLDVAATYIVLFTIYGAVLELSGGAAGSSSTCRSPRSAARGARAGRTAVASGLPARHRLRLGHGDRGQRRRGDLADPAPGRLPAGTGRRRARRGRASARSCRRRRSARPRSSSPSTCEVSYLTVLGWAIDPDAPVLPGHPARRRDRRPPVRRARRSSSTPDRRGGCWAASATTSRR